jgi:hypothetical protein
MLPSLVASATVIIIVAEEGSDSFGAVSVFLNIVAVGFICELDNLVAKVVVHSSSAVRHSNMVADLATSDQVNLRLPVRWLQNRVTAICLCISISMETLFMEELILTLNPIFGGSLLGIGHGWHHRRFERIGPEYSNDANCNKVIFAVQAMTFYRAFFVAVVAYAFDVLGTCWLHTHQQSSRTVRLLTDHTLGFLLGGLIVYAAFRSLVSWMEDLRVSDPVFGW